MRLERAPTIGPASKHKAPTNGKSHSGSTASGNGHTGAAVAGGALPLARYTGDLCPDCGTALVFEEGCSKCVSCGFARC